MGKPDHSPPSNADVKSEQSNTSGVVQLYPQAPGTSSGRLLRPGVVQLYPQAPGTCSGRLLRPGGGPAIPLGSGYKFWSPCTTWGWSSYTPRHRVQVQVAFYDLGVVQLYSQAPGTNSGRLLRPGGGSAVLPGTGYKFWSPFTTCMGCRWTYFPWSSHPEGWPLTSL